MINMCLKHIYILFMCMYIYTHILHRQLELPLCTARPINSDVCTNVHTCKEISKQVIRRNFIFALVVYFSEYHSARCSKLREK